MEFQIYAETSLFTRKALWIKNPDKHTDAYYVHFQGRSGMTIHRGGPQGPMVGRVEFHKWKGHTEIWFENNQRVEMMRDSTFSKTESLPLPAAPGKSSQFSWKPARSIFAAGDLKLEDADGTVFAMFSMARGRSKDGTLTLTMSGLSQQFTDQIFVSCIAIEEKQRRQRRANGVAAASAGC